MVSSIEIPKTFKSSFAAHSDAEIKGMHQLYALTADVPKDDLVNLDKLEKLFSTRALLLDTKKLANQRKAFPTKLAFYQEELAHINPASFPFLTAKQILRKKNNLIFTYSLLFAQYQLDAAEDRTHNFETIQDMLDLCSQRIRELDLSSHRGKPPKPKDQLQGEINHYTKCLGYLGLTILAQWIVERIKELMNNKTGALDEWMTAINSRRLYWVWAGGMLETALGLFASDFAHVKDAGQAFSQVAPISGYISFVLYFARLGIQLYLVLKHSFNPSAEESLIPPWERFTTQWNQRKFSILNDILWGAINMVCFLWLNGRGMLGYAGNLATVALLSADLMLNLWRHWEATAHHKAYMLDLKKDRKALKDELDALELKISTCDDLYESNQMKAKKPELDEELRLINKIITKEKLDWKYKDKALFNDCCYAFGLVLAFCVVVCFLCPPAALAPLTVTILGLCGAVACFVITTMYTYASSNLKMEKIGEGIKNTMEECEELLKSFNDELDPKQKKYLYMQMKTLMAGAHHQSQLQAFQSKIGLRELVIDSLFPFVVFISLIFLPTGVGWGIIAAVLSIGVLSYFIVNPYKPEAAKLPEFDKADYKAFLENTSLSHFQHQNETTSIKPSRGFFNVTVSKENSESEQDSPLLINSLRCV
ncbi:MAG: DUF4118 domain-containing protein [Tatlockia sp.]|nr:DUF4118 domain-containing protein [Tatlockia sp.]